MQNAISAIKAFFDEIDWSYSFDEERSLFDTAVTVNNTLGSVNIRIRVKETNYTVYAFLNNKADEQYFPKVAEYLHRANYGMLNGNFEMDFSDGEIRYKTYVNFDDVELSSNVIRSSIFVPVYMIEKYGMNLMKLLLGVGEPAALIEEAENADN